MLVHLSNTSPYVCDLNRGPIEQTNRMASAPTKKATALLGQKESFPKATRTPLKLLAPDEVPMDTTATATDINASLQPVWYTEQTIVDDQHVQQEDIASIIQEQQQQQGRSSIPRTTLKRSTRSTCSTLPPIQSETPSMIAEDDEEELIPSQPLLIHKSSTFTIEPSMNVDSPLNDSEKENTIKDDTINGIIPPSDDSFRALEHLLGLGSTGTVRDSPKTNHDTLSLTVVTPTDIINTTRTSLRMSFAPKNGSDSLPSSQNIPIMPTIESITSTEPPSFLVDNTTMEDEQPSIVATTMNQQTSFDITDNDTIKDDTNNDDETNFSFELNDFPDNSNTQSTVDVPAPAPPMITIRAPTCADVAYRALVKPRASRRVSQPVQADSPLAETNKHRSSAPTSRMLRSSCRRISTDSASQNPMVPEQPSSNIECFVDDTNTNTDPQMELVEVASLPEEDEIEQEKSTSVTLNLASPKAINRNASIQSEQFLTPTEPLTSMLSREYTYNTPKRRASERCRSMLNSSRATPIQQQQQQTTINEGKEEASSPSIASKSMLGILLTQPTEAEPSVLQQTLTTSMAPSPVRTSTRRTTNEVAINSPSIASKSMLGILLTQPTEAEPSVLQKTLTTSIAASPVRTSTRKTINEVAIGSPSIASKSMLGILLTQPTEVEPSVLQKTLTTSIAASPIRTSTRKTINEVAINSPSIASKSMLGILLTQPTEAEPSVLQKTLTTSIAASPIQNSARKSDRLSTNPTPRASINPLHSSTPSASRHKSLQIVSIGEQEQVSTIVPPQINNEIQEEQQEMEMVPLDTTEENIRTIEIGVQTTPSIDISSRRHFNAIEQSTTPVIQMNQSSSIVIVNEQKELTPLQTKAVINLQRNVRFQLTPSTDARLVAKEKLEETLRGLKPDVDINPTPIIAETKQANVKSAPIKKATKPKKKVIASKTKKSAPKQTQPKQQPITKKPRQPRKEKPIKQQKPIASTKESKVKPKVVAPKKRVQQKQPTTEVIAPTKRIPRKRTITEVTAPVERAPRKRTMPEVTTNPIEPVVKRAKTSKSVEVLPPILTPRKTRSRSTNNKKNISEPENITPTTKTSKRRLQSVEKKEEIKKKAVETNIQSIPSVQNFELSQEERQKIEALTVAALKSRLNTYKEDIPKGAKKSDLIALLIKIETNLIKERKPIETTTVNTTSMTTRRRLLKK